MRTSIRILLSIVFLITGLTISFNSFSAYLKFVPQKITQPDGTVIKCFGSGDEFYNWLHDENGYTIIRSQTDSYYYYAVLEDEMLIPSQIKVGSTDPKDAGLDPWINISPEKMESIRSHFLEHYMPEKPHREGFIQPTERAGFSMINNLVVYIRFNNQSEFSEDTLFYYNMFNNTSEGYNSMKNYFWEATYETLEMLGWFYPVPNGTKVISYKDIFPRNYYLPYNAVTNPNGYKEGERAEREHALLKRACEYIENEVPVDIDLDNNGDGYVDNVIFIVRGEPSAWSTLLWPHRWALWNEVVFINGKQVWDYNFQIENHLNSDRNGVLCHESYHTLGAPDLYHYGTSNITSVGRWDLMDVSVNPPQSMGAYMKYRYGGWIEDIPEITECGRYTINPITSPDNNCYKIKSPNSTLEYFVVEYRSKEGTFEGSVPGSGLVVYRIDTRYDGQGNASGPPDEVYVFRPGGTPTGNGTPNEANLSAEEGRTEINDESDPYSFLQDGQLGGLDISNVGYAEETISFEVSFAQKPVPGFTSSDTIITEICGIDFFDDSFCGVDSWNWFFEGAVPSSSSDENPTGIYYAEEGSYDVTLNATNQYGSALIILTDYITVSKTALPVIAFSVSDTIVCSGEPIMIYDDSEVCPESWEWEITPDNGVEYIDGTSSFSQNPVISINEIGIYTVNVTVTNSNGSSSLTKEDYISVGGLDIPFMESFENSVIRNKLWTVVNNDNYITWVDFPVFGNDGLKAAGIDNYDYFKFSQRDQLISPPLNLSGTDYASLFFEHAYALFNNDYEFTDTLVVKISSDCGETWTRLLTLFEDGSRNFVTRVPIESRFVPSFTKDWCGVGIGSKCNGIDISEWSGNDNVMIMFESVRIAGNNLYIDNVRVDPVVPVPESEIHDEKLLRIYPNPTNGNFKVSVDEEIENGVIVVHNSSGQKIFTEAVAAGESNMMIDLGKNPKGLYFVRIIGNGINRSGKVLVR